MKRRISQWLAIALAGALQVMPLLRTALPWLQSVTPGAAYVLPWVAGTVAYLSSYHAVSAASSWTISINPPTATVGVPYTGVATFSGSHSGSINSMNMSNTCLGSFGIAPGLTLTYPGSGYKCNITGTPTTQNTNLTFTLSVYNHTGCTYSGSDTATRTSPTFPIYPAGGALKAPTFVVPPQNIIAVVGQDVYLSGTASGNPTPGYYWQKSFVNVPGGNSSTLLLTNVQLTNAGTYTLNATNSQGTVGASCVLTVCAPAGTNYTALDYTNYAPAGIALTMNTTITNIPLATNSWQWYVNNGLIPAANGGTNQNFPLTAGQVIPTKSGTYTVAFTSSNGTNIFANGIGYESYWQFGWVPNISVQPSGVTTNVGSNATFTCTLTGSSLANVLLYKNATNLVYFNSYSNYNPSLVSATTNISVTLSNISAGDAGNYTFVVTNFWGSTTSTIAPLGIVSSLAVSSPVGVTNYVGKNVSLSVTPTGTAPFAYQWLKGAASISNGGNISGANTNVLTFTSAAVTNSGSYSVIVTNSGGSVTSSVAQVSIVPVPSVTFAANPSNFALNATGLAGSQYIIQYTTNVDTGPWIPLFTNTTPANGIINFVDPVSPFVGGTRIYRVQFP